MGSATTPPPSREAEDLRYWLALTFIRDIGPVTGKHLLSAFHSPRKIFEAPLKDLLRVEDIQEARARRICDFNAWDRVDSELAAIRKRGVTIITYAESDYPDALRQLDDAPIVLYTRGAPVPADRYAIAVVGSRRMTEYGRRTAERLASDLAVRGITVVSGMARGIDTTSHKAALRAGGRSIAVLGCGIDRPYPAENVELLDALSRSGSVISEFPMGTPPNKENFPRRNRVISGLSLGVLVIEATIDSGSLITAGYAIEQGRDVFAIPGNVTSVTSEGTNALIKKGAKLVQRVEDILEEIAPLVKGLMRVAGDGTAPGAGRIPAGLEISEEEKAICCILGEEPKHIDTIAREARTTPSRLLSILLALELKGLVRQVEGKRFYRV